MFTFYVSNPLGTYVIHNPSGGEAQICLAPKLTLSLNAPGSFEFTIPPQNDAFSIVTEGARIRVDNDNTPIWEGSVQKRKETFDGNAVISCIGRLAEMADVPIGREVFSAAVDGNNGSFPGFLNNLFTYANIFLPYSQRIALGTCAFKWQKNAEGVDYTNGVTMAERDDCPTLWEYLTTNQDGRVQGDTSGEYIDPTAPLIAPYNGIIRPRYSTSSILTIDFLSDGELGDNVIQFGRNLLDLSKEKSIETTFNGIMPTYERRDSADGEYHIYYYNFDTDTATMWCQSNDAANCVLWDYAAIDAMNGKRILKRVDFGREISDPSVIPTLAANELAKAKNPTNEIEVTAFDMALIDSEYDLFEVGNYYNLYEDEAGNASVYQLMEMELNFLNPESNRYTFGSKPQTLTGAVKSGALGATKTEETGPTGWTESYSLGSQSNTGLNASYRINATARLIELTVEGTISGGVSLSGATPYYFANALPASAAPMGNLITPLGASNGNNHFLRVGILPGNTRRPFIYTASSLSTSSEYVAAKILFGY